MICNHREVARAPFLQIMTDMVQGSNIESRSEISPSPQRKGNVTIQEDLSHSHFGICHHEVPRVSFLEIMTDMIQGSNIEIHSEILPSPKKEGRV